MTHSNQVLPYIPYAKYDIQLQSMLKGVLFRQVFCILKGDAYANAFNKDFSSPSPH